MKKLFTLEIYYDIPTMKYRIRLKFLGFKIAIWEYDSIEEKIIWTHNQLSTTTAIHFSEHEHTTKCT